MSRCGPQALKCFDATAFHDGDETDQWKTVGTGSTENDADDLTSKADDKRNYKTLKEWNNIFRKHGLQLNFQKIE